MMSINDIARERPSESVMEQAVREEYRRVGVETHGQYVQYLQDHGHDFEVLAFSRVRPENRLALAYHVIRLLETERRLEEMSRNDERDLLMMSPTGGIKRGYRG
ncbi:hypothetical protein KY363_07080 [Candidatus Woesearchaeota archaeon]|nr:hypothetical protein [Candidatus Woesearchaeota archaeon]